LQPGSVVAIQPAKERSAENAAGRGQVQ